MREESLEKILDTVRKLKGVGYANIDEIYGNNNTAHIFIYIDNDILKNKSDKLKLNNKIKNVFGYFIKQNTDNKREALQDSSIPNLKLNVEKDEWGNVIKSYYEIDNYVFDSLDFIEPMRKIDINLLKEAIENKNTEKLNEWGKIRYRLKSKNYYLKLDKDEIQKLEEETYNPNYPETQWVLDKKYIDNEIKKALKKVKMKLPEFIEEQDTKNLANLVNEFNKILKEKNIDYVITNTDELKKFIETFSSSFKPQNVDRLTFEEIKSRLFTKLYDELGFLSKDEVMNYFNKNNLRKKLEEKINDLKQLQKIQQKTSYKVRNY